MCAETKGDRAKLRLTRGYVYLCYARADGNGTKTVSHADVAGALQSPNSIRDRQLLLLRPRRGRACRRGPYFTRKGVGRGTAGNELRGAMLSAPSMAEKHGRRVGYQL
jgi:hypothetical protein